MLWLGGRGFGALQFLGNLGSMDQRDGVPRTQTRRQGDSASHPRDVQARRRMTVERSGSRHALLAACVGITASAVRGRRARRAGGAGAAADGPGGGAGRGQGAAGGPVAAHLGGRRQDGGGSAREQGPLGRYRQADPPVDESRIRAARGREVASRGGVTMPVPVARQNPTTGRIEVQKIVGAGPTGDSGLQIPSPRPPRDAHRG